MTLSSEGCALLEDALGTGQETLTTFEDTAREIGILSAEFRRYYRENDARLAELSANITETSDSIFAAAAGLRRTADSVADASDKLGNQLATLISHAKSLSQSAERTTTEIGDKIRTLDLDGALQCIGRVTIDEALKHDTIRGTYPAIIKSMPASLSRSLADDFFSPFKRFFRSLTPWIRIAALAFGLMVLWKRRAVISSFVRRLLNAFIVVQRKRIHKLPLWAMIGAWNWLRERFNAVLLMCAAIGAMNLACTTYEWQVQLAARSEEVNPPAYDSSRLVRHDKMNHQQAACDRTGHSDMPSRMVSPLRWRVVEEVSKQVFRYGRGFGSDSLRACVRGGVAIDQLSNAIVAARKSARGDRLILSTRAMRARVDHAVSAEANAQLYLVIAPSSVAELEIRLPERRMSPCNATDTNERMAKISPLDPQSPPSDNSEQLLVIKLDPAMAAMSRDDGRRDHACAVTLEFCNPQTGRSPDNVREDILHQVKKSVGKSRMQRDELKNLCASQSLEEASLRKAEHLSEQSVERRCQLAHGKISVYVPDLEGFSEPFYADPGLRIVLRVYNRKVLGSLNATLGLTLYSSADVSRLHPLFSKAQEAKCQLSHWKRWFDAAAFAPVTDNDSPLYPSVYEASIDVCLRLRGLGGLLNVQTRNGRH